MLDVKDEILEDEARYQIRDKNGNILFDDISIEMITSIIQAGTFLNKALFDSIDADIKDRLKIEDKTSTEEAQACIDDLKYMTALKVWQLINAKALPSKQMSIKTGTISNLGVIPQTSGYNNYLYFAALSNGSDNVSTNSGASTNLYIKTECTVDQSTREVIAYLGIATNQITNPRAFSGTANYLEIAWN